MKGGKKFSTALIHCYCLGVFVAVLTTDCIKEGIQVMQYSATKSTEAVRVREVKPSCMHQGAWKLNEVLI